MEIRGNRDHEFLNLFWWFHQAIVFGGDYWITSLLQGQFSHIISISCYQNKINNYTGNISLNYNFAIISIIGLATK